MRQGKCLERIIRIKSIEQEYRVAMIARGVQIAELTKNPSKLTDVGLEQVHFEKFRGNLDATYLVRIFAESETGLRDYWTHLSKRQSFARTYDMIQALSSRRKIDFREIKNVHDVRIYRNKLVHEEDIEARVIEIGEARKSLCVFFGKLPEDW